MTKVGRGRVGREAVHDSIAGVRATRGSVTGAWDRPGRTGERGEPPGAHGRGGSREGPLAQLVGSSR
jgi:hypothetical protein